MYESFIKKGGTNPAPKTKKQRIKPPAQNPHDCKECDEKDQRIAELEAQLESRERAIDNLVDSR